MIAGQRLIKACAESASLGDQELFSRTSSGSARSAAVVSEAMLRFMPVCVRVVSVCLCACVCVCVYSQLQASTAHDCHAFACFTLHIRVLFVVVHGCMQHVCTYVCMYVPGAWRCCRFCRKPRRSFSSARPKMYACMYNVRVYAYVRMCACMTWMG